MAAADNNATFQVEFSDISVTGLARSMFGNNTFLSVAFDGMSFNAGATTYDTPAYKGDFWSHLAPSGKWTYTTERARDLNTKYMTVRIMSKSAMGGAQAIGTTKVRIPPTVGSGKGGE